MINQSLSNEDILFNHVLSGKEMMTKLEKECREFVINLLVTHSNKNLRDHGWGKDCEFAFIDFVRKDPFWSQQSEQVQKRFIAFSVVKVSIFVELFFESMMS